MKKFAAFAAATIAALSLTASVSAENWVLQPEQPVITYIEETAPESSNAEITVNTSVERLYLEDNVYFTEEYTALTDEAQGEEKSVPKAILISLAIGLVIALIVCLVMKSFMKTSRPKHTANDYIRKNSFNITRSRDIFIYSEISKKKRQKQENK